MESMAGKLQLMQLQLPLQLCSSSSSSRPVNHRIQDTSAQTALRRRRKAGQAGKEVLQQGLAARS